MWLSEMFDRALRTRSQTWARFRIPPERVVGEPAEAVPLEAERTYFEVRLSQMHLRDQREYTLTWIPLGCVMTEFQAVGGRRMVPFVVGPGLLERTGMVKRGDQVDFVDIRVAGPHPYLGDDIGIFVGLFRCQTGDWARRALSLLEVVAKTIDPTRLSGLVDVSGPLVDSVEQFFGVRELEPRICIDWSLRTSAFQAGYLVALNVPAERLPEAEQQRFWVAGDRLHTRESAGGELREYGDADFILLHTDVLVTRPDHHTMEFESVHWPKVREHLENGHEDAGRAAMKVLAGSILGCADLLPGQRASLIVMYKQQYDEALQTFRSIEQLGRAGYRGARLPGPMSEADLRAAAARPWPGYSPNEPLETVLTRLDI